MNSDNAYALVMMLAVAVNYATLFIVLPRKYSLSISTIAAILFTIAFYTILNLTGNLSNMLGGFRGLVHLPLMILLFNVPFFQKLFAVLLAMILSGFQITLASTIAEFSTSLGSGSYYMLASSITLAMFAVYLTLTCLFFRRILERLFISGQQTEWALYSLGAFVSFSVMMFANNAFSGTGRIVILCFTVWSFVVLCFSIINAHEKARKNYEAEFARDVISSGHEHYLKMNEMHETLRILRHDYKYHLDTLDELLSSGNQDETEKYLTDIKTQLDEKELPHFCSNSVLNALLAGYAERCAKLDIKYSIQISLPDNITVQNYEMCIVLGNLLENAVEACAGCAETNRKLELAINTQNANLAVMVKNNFNGEVIQDKDRLLSKKKDGGLGLRSVQAVAARHGGELMTEWGDNTFTAYVLMRV